MSEEEKQNKLEQFILPRRLERMDEILAKRSDQLTIVLDRVYHEHNISAVLRSADAFGIQTVHIIGAGNGGFSSGITQGADRWLDIVSHENPDSAIDNLEKDGYEIVLVQAEEQSETIQSVPVISLPFEKKLALVFGSEKQGISEVVSARANLATHIPMHGFVESFNISVAAAICLFCSTFSAAKDQRRLAPLSDEKKIRVKKNWVKGDIRNVEIVERSLSKDK